MDNSTATQNIIPDKDKKHQPFPVEEIRSQFPALQLKFNGLPRIYLDNPAGTQIPQPVISAVMQSMVEASSNLGGYFASSRAADANWLSAHQAMADMLGATTSEEINIGPSMTALTSHMSRSIGANLQPGDEIIVTRMDHEGDISPWLHMAQDHELVIKWLPFNKKTWKIEADDLESMLSERTRLIALNYASNLTGSINQIQKLAAIVKNNSEAIVYVDAVQLAPHNIIDVEELGCDFVACSSYKFYGPHLGILWGRKELLDKLDAYKCRCASDELPEKFALGTPQTELFAGLTATIDYLAHIGSLVGNDGNRRQKLVAAYEQFGLYEDFLTMKLIDGIKAISGTTIHGLTDKNELNHRVPTVSFTHSKHKPADIAKALAEHAIFAWSGHNYAFEVVNYLGIDSQQGVVRLGLAHYNTEVEVDRVLNVLGDILN